MLKKILTGILICIFLLVGNVSAQADTLEPTPQLPVQAGSQVEVSSEELQKFANAVKQLQVTYREFQTLMVQAVEDEDLTQQRFTEIYQAQQKPEVKPATEITETEKQNFDKAFPKIVKIQQENQSHMKQIVEKEGLEVNRFNQIFAAALDDPELQTKIRQKLQS